MNFYQDMKLLMILITAIVVFLLGLYQYSFSPSIGGAEKYNYQSKYTDAMKKNPSRAKLEQNKLATNQFFLSKKKNQKHLNKENIGKGHQKVSRKVSTRKVKKVFTMETLQTQILSSLHSSSEWKDFLTKYRKKYNRQVPAHMDRWYLFAKRHRCELDSYDNIDNDLAPFRKMMPLSHTILEDTRRQLPDSFIAHVQVKNGKVQGLPDKYNNLGAFVHDLPDMEFFYNLEDYPRVLKKQRGQAKVKKKSDRFDQDPLKLGRVESFMRTCVNMPNLDYLTKFHGYFFTFSAPQTFQLVPVFSPTRIEQCHLDILIPSKKQYGQWTPSNNSNIVWNDKKSELLWRGGTSGGGIKPGAFWRESHRFRFVKAFGHIGKEKRLLPTMNLTIDVGFNSVTDCNYPDECKHVRREFPIKGVVPFQEYNRRKYAFDVDGNTLSYFFLPLLRSNSLIFRASVFRTWFSDRIKAWTDFIPVGFTYIDLARKLKWAEQHPIAAKKIAQHSEKIAKTRLRDVDMDCYTFRLLLEYASLFEKM